MHARELLELAALVAEHGCVLIGGSGPIPARSIEAYWSASRCRVDRWQREIKRSAAQSPAETAKPACPHNTSVRGVIEEVLTGEVLTRVWTAVMCAYDRHHGTDLMEPVARSVLSAHTEARHRVLVILAASSGMPAEEAVRLDQLRRRSERWTDVLLGQMAALGDVGEFAFDPERAADFAEDLAAHAAGEGRCQVWPLMMSSMRACFRHGLAAVSPNADLNAKIAASIVSLFPPELFDAAGVPESLWLVRMAQTTSVAEGLIEEMLLS